MPMFRLWGKIIKDNRMLRDTVIENGNYAMSRTAMVLDAVDQMCYEFDLGHPVWLDKTVEEFKRHDKARFTQDNIPVDQAPAMRAVVAALVGLGEDWQAGQVWARLKEICARQGDDPVRTVETVDLTVEAVNSQGGRRIFTARDYPEFTVASPAAVDFFKYFTKQNHE